MRLLATQTRAVRYTGGAATAEFDAMEYFRMVAECISSCRDRAGLDPCRARQLVLTGQAESLVMIGTDGTPVYNAISWLDMRSEAECKELRRVFPETRSYPITGQPSIIPT